MKIQWQGMALGGLQLLVACGAPASTDPESTSTATSQADLSACARGPVLVQAGASQTLLGVTGDGQVLYQEGAVVYATAARAGAVRQVVAQVPAGNIAFVYVSGNVAFCWTNPDRSLPGFGVSPLVVYSAAGGAHAASASSSIGTFASASSPDGRSVVFPTNSNPEGTVGDLELASADFSQHRILEAGIPMDFPFGACRPFAAFVGAGHAAPLVTLSCKSGETTATLARWSGGAETDLLTGVATPPFFTASASGTSFYTTLASTSFPVVVSAGHAPVTLDQVPAGRGTFTREDNIVYLAHTGTQIALRRADLQGNHATLVPAVLGGVLTNLFGSDLITKPWTTLDGTKLAYPTQVDPNTGLTDTNLVDPRGKHAAVVVDAVTDDTLFGLPFTLDSQHFLYARVADPTTGIAPMFEFGGAAPRQFSDANGWSYAPAKGSTISYNDNVSPDITVADLKLVDLAKATLQPRLVAAQADLTYLASPDGRLLVFTSNVAARPAGLYVAIVDE